LCNKKSENRITFTPSENGGLNNTQIETKEEFIENKK
jgi:hypothetical protein